MPVRLFHRGQCCQQTIGPPHQVPVVLIRPSTTQASLIMMAVFIHARPREPVRAPSAKKLLQEFQWVAPWLRFFQ